MYIYILHSFVIWICNIIWWHWVDIGYTLGTHWVQHGATQWVGCTAATLPSPSTPRVSAVPGRHQFSLGSLGWPWWRISRKPVIQYRASNSPPVLGDTCDTTWGKIAFCFACAGPRISEVWSPQKVSNPSGLKQTYMLKMDVATFCHKGGNYGFCFGLTSLQNPCQISSLWWAGAAVFSRAAASIVVSNATKAVKTPDTG